MNITCIADSMAAGDIRVGLFGDAETYCGSATRDQLIALRLFAPTQFPAAGLAQATGRSKGEIAWELRRAVGGQWQFTLWRPKPEQKAVLCTLLHWKRIPPWVLQTVTRAGRRRRTDSQDGGLTRLARGLGSSTRATRGGRIVGRFRAAQTVVSYAEFGVPHR